MLGRQSRYDGEGVGLAGCGSLGGCEQRCGCLLELVSEEIIDEMCQLVKANSISGVKMASVQVVYTPHSNLRKEADMKETDMRAASSSISCSSRNVKSGTGASPRSAEHRSWTTALTLGDE